MKKIISYSLYGAIPKYLDGALRNCELVKTFYPGWIPRFYVGDSVPYKTIQSLKEIGAEIEKIKGDEDERGTLWRFLVFKDLNVSIAMIRDVDSTITKREVTAVNEWLVSNKSCHIMRDHPHHSHIMLAGLWGAKTDQLRNIENLIDKYDFNTVSRGIDQDFLRDIIYPEMKNDVLVHDSFFYYEPHIKFSTPRVDFDFVGESLDLEERDFQRHIIESFEKDKFGKIKHHVKGYLNYLRGNV
jgi:hypothetical protein